MSLIIFKNESKIKIYNCDNKTTIRGKRSELISFWCNECERIHVDFPKSETVIIDDMMFCKSGYENILKELSEDAFYE